MLLLVYQKSHNCLEHVVAFKESLQLSPEKIRQMEQQTTSVKVNHLCGFQPGVIN